jgi:hypothetical protein
MMYKNTFKFPVKLNIKKAPFTKCFSTSVHQSPEKRLNVTNRYVNTEKLRINPTKVIIILYSNYNMKMNYNQG